MEVKKNSSSMVKQWFTKIERFSEINITFRGASAILLLKMIRLQLKNKLKMTRAFR